MLSSTVALIYTRSAAVSNLFGGWNSYFGQGIRYLFDGYNDLGVS